tara:strand:- start:499 stop:801 length:303 start_codon:yes stop_codon:yes gene_type:complete
MAPRRKTTRSRSMVSKGGKLGPTLKKEGIFKGSGTYVAKQTGIQAMKKVVPAYLMLVALSAATPDLGSKIAASTATIPVANVLTSTASTYGASLRARLGR